MSKDIRDINISETKDDFRSQLNTEGIQITYLEKENTGLRQEREKLHGKNLTLIIQVE